MTRYKIIKPDGSWSEHKVDWPKDPGYEQIRFLVTPILSGATLEHVSVLYAGKPADMFVDETGLLKRLPRNKLATEIYRANALSKMPSGADPEALPAIYGVAVLFPERVWF